jgi:hypothetical protein
MTATPMLAETSSNCSPAEFRQFDFWAGDWNVFDIDAHDPAATARVDPILDGCVLHEDYRQSDGFSGQSFTTYDATHQLWHQSWVTNRGSRLEMDGSFANGVLTLNGNSPTTGALVRVVWKPEKGEVRETAVISKDQGKTWAPLFDMVFRPKTSK